MLSTCQKRAMAESELGALRARPAGAIGRLMLLLMRWSFEVRGSRLCRAVNPPSVVQYNSKNKAGAIQLIEDVKRKVVEQ